MTDATRDRPQPYRASWPRHRGLCVFWLEGKNKRHLYFCPETSWSYTMFRMEEFSCEVMF